MAERVTGRRRVLVARSLHTEYRDVLRTYAKNSVLHVEEIPFTAAGTLDLAALKSTLTNEVCAVVQHSPNFFGAVEGLHEVAAATQAAGALLVVAVAEALSLGLLKPPSEADIVAMEGQSFGLAPSYGGPFVGVIAYKEKYVRQIPGRLAGQTTDLECKRGFVLTLATREQQISREKATSKICTNHAL
jgi:glycine dehydrogenase subunit 1